MSLHPRIIPASFFAKWLTCAVLSLVCASAYAAPKKKQGTQDAPDNPAKTAHLRIWKAEFASKRAVRVTLRIAGRKGVGTNLSGPLSGYSFADYSVVPPASGALEVYEVAEPGLKVATIDARLAPGSYSTLILREDSDAISAELVDDQSPGGKTGELKVRNFVPDLGAIQVEAGSDFHARLADADAFIHLRGLPKAKVEVRASTVKARGKVIRWSSEVDFAQAPRWTVLIHADPYGRIRSRVAIDGSGAFANGSTETPPGSTKSARAPD